MKRYFVVILLGCTFSILLSANRSQACTNFIVTKGASKTGSVMICYLCDAPFSSLLHRIPAADHEPGTFVEFPHIRTTVKVKQVAHTYAVIASNGIGHINEFQVAIGETTFGGRKKLRNKDGLHYADMMTIALQRAKTAREAITVMAGLVEQYGYKETGESFSIGDTKEAWIMELIGKGPEEKGVVWVAVKIPDGQVSCHANQSRIGEFPLHEPGNCLYAKDVISFAVKKGFYDPKSGKPFNFSDVYNPASKRIKKACAMRVWSLLRRAAPSLHLSPDYHRGVAGAKRYPLSVTPDHKLSTADVFSLLRDHYEGTQFDMTRGENAGAFGSPYQKRTERSISIRGTVFSIVTQSRASLPDPVGGVLWYSPDDTYFSCYTPFYCGIDALPQAYTVCNRKKFSWDSAWWTFNFVDNYANLKYTKMKKDIQAVQREIENNYLALQPVIEKTAVDLYKTDSQLMTQYLTNYSVSGAEQVLNRWHQLADKLIVKYNDR